MEGGAEGGEGQLQETEHQVGAVQRLAIPVDGMGRTPIGHRIKPKGLAISFCCVARNTNQRLSNERIWEI